MAMIGEELMALLGMIPVRDQAGIPRGNLAQETAANAARMKATLEPQPDQMPVRGLPPPSGPSMNGSRPPIPPDVQLPDNVPAGYASAKSPVTTAIPPNGRTVQNALPNSPLPEPDEARTIATAPSNALTQLDQQIARREQMGNINSVLSGLQLLTNSFNRNPESAAAIRTSAMEGLGGGGMDVKDITDIYKTHELLRKADDDRRAAAQATQLRERMIQNMMAKRGWSREQAEGAIATGTAKDVYDQDKTRQYAEDQATVAQRDAMAKRKGEIAKKLDMTEDEVATQLLTREGTTDLIKRLDPESRSTIEGRKATTRSTLATADKTELDNQSTRLGLDDVTKVIADPTEAAAVLKRPASEVALFARQGPAEWKAYLKDHLPTAITERAAKEATRTETEMKNARTTAANMSWLAARSDPAAWAAKHGLDPRLANPMLENVETYTKFLETASPTHSTLGQEWLLINNARDAENARRPEGTPAKSYVSPEAVKDIMAPAKPSAADTVAGEGYKIIQKQLGESQEKAQVAHDSITGALDQSMRAWQPKMQTGSTMAKSQSDLRKLIARVSGVPDPEVDATDVFLSTQAGIIAKNIKAALPGALSNDEMKFLEKWYGGREQSEEALHQIMAIHEKLGRASIEQHNQRHERELANPKAGKAYDAYQPVPMPDPSYFSQESIKRNPAMLRKLVKRQDDPAVVRDFNQTFGAQSAQWFIDHKDQFLGR